MTLEELTTPLTVEEVKAKIYAAIEARGVSTTTWKEGAVVRTIVAALSIVLAAFSTLQALIAKSGFLGLAEGDWLTLVARFVYGVDRDIGAFATGNVELDNSGGGTFDVAIGDLVVANPSTGKTYRNTAAFMVAASQQNVVVPIQAVEIGTASTSAATTITQLVTTMLGITCSNPIAVVGRDPESDTDLRIRCNEKTGTLSPDGPRDAYAFVARSAVRLADGTAIGVTRVRVIADGLGNVTVYVATATGGLTGTAGDPATDLGAVNDAIQKLAAPLAVTATTVNASNNVIAVTYELWLRDTVTKTVAQVQADVAAKLTAFITSQPIGGHTISPATGKVYVSAIETAVGSAFPTDTIKILITVPAADVAVATNEVPVAGSFTGTIHFVPGGLI